MTDVYQQLPLAAARGAGGPPGYGAPPAKHTVHWFRKGLRLHDNPSLREGLKGASTFRCIFILDPWFAGSSNVGINKWRFLLQCLEDLDQSLRKLNSRLFVVRGQPADALPKLFKVSTRKVCCPLSGQEENQKLWRAWRGTLRGKHG
ncbi:Cryptochrome 2 transcript variant e [Gryllus bimaculatus]|nr:Cryptochrome 2 transcript variant e [Gryllus bimaculatus]